MVFCEDVECNPSGAKHVEMDERRHTSTRVVHTTEKISLRMSSAYKKVPHINKQFI